MLLKKIKKKIILIFSAAFMTMSCLIPTPVQAGNNHIVNAGYYNGHHYRFKMPNGYDAWGQAFWTSVDGQPAFCVDVKTLWQNGGGYTEFPYNNVTQRQMSLIAYYGWEKHSNAPDSVNWRLATQYMIWESMGNRPISITGFNYQYYKTQIQNGMNRHNLRPSFHNQSYELNVNESITLTDTNGVLSEFAEVSSQNGVTVVRNGNQLTLTPTENASENIELNFKKIPQNFTGVSVVYRKPGAQDVAKFYINDPIPSTISLKVNKHGSLEIGKQDTEGNFVPNTSFKVSYQNDMSNPIGTYTTQANGKVKINDLRPTTVYIQETNVPANLVLDPTIKQVTIIPNQTVSFNAKNAIQKGTINLKKVDADTTTPQGEATLQGAVYGLFAKENVINPITGKVYHPKGTKVAEATTDAQGNASFHNQNLGSYYVQEIKAPIGYQLNSKKYDLDLVYGGQTVNLVTKDLTVSDKIISGKFSIKKTISNNKDLNEILEPEQGAEFTAIAEKYVTQHGSFNEALKHLNTYGKNEYDVVKTNQNGDAISKSLAFGPYVMKQTGTADPDILLFKDEIRFNINKHDQVFHYNIKNTWFQTLIKIVKKDAETNKTILLAGTKFKIKDTKTNQYLKQKVGNKYIDTFTTDETGTVFLPNPVNANKHLQLEEVTAPNGYLLNKKPIPFTVTITNDHPEKDEDGVPITVVEIKDKPVKGKISIKKIGEVLDRVEQDKNGNYQFIYKKQSLAGMKVNVIAKENILDPADHSILFAKDTIVKTGVTTEEGLEFNDLPLGHYSVEEVEAPQGFLLNPKKYDVNLTYQDDQTEIISNTTVIENERQKVEIEVNKIDKDLRNQIAGAEISLFNTEDIIVNGKVIPKDTKMETVISKEKSHTSFVVDLPLNHKWYVKETKAPKNYRLSDKVFHFETTYQGQLQEKLSFNHTFENEVVKGKMSFIKKGDLFVSTDTGQTEFGVMNTPVFETSNILGAEISVYAAEDIKPSHQNVYYQKDELIETIVSDLDAVETNLLPAGKYYWVETKAPQGFVPNDEKHYFEISGTDKEEIEIVHQELRNERPNYEIDFIKQMESDKYQSDKFKDAYQDVVFGIYTRDDTYDWKGNVTIAPNTLVFTSGITKDRHLANKVTLPVGNYYLKEIRTHEAYELDEKEYDFSISLDSKEMVTININNGKPIVNPLKKYKVEVNKVDSLTNKAIKSKDFAFTLYEDQDCKEELITVHANQAKGTATFEDLTHGTYYIKETQAPEGYLLSNEVLKVDINTEGVFFNDKKVNEDDEVYSYRYLNEMLPTIKTGDSTNSTGYVILLTISSIIATGMYLTRRNKTTD